MTDFACPRIAVGGVPITEQDFSWSRTAGVLPYTTTIRVPAGAISDTLAAVQNPTSIELQICGDTIGAGTAQTITFDKVYLLEPRKIDPYHVQWSIADSRWGWRGKKLYYSYNKTRVSSEKGFTVPDGETSPAILRQPFDTFSVGRYLPWSLNNERPWTVLEMLQDQLGKLGISYAAQAKDNSYVIENVEASGIDVYRGMADLLAKSRLNMGILDDGRVYVYSIDFFDESQINQIAQLQAASKTKAGVIYRQDLSRIRPKNVNVRFEAKREVRVIAPKNIAAQSDVAPNRIPSYIYEHFPVWNRADIEAWRVLGCINVIQIPYEFSEAGITYKIGEWCPINFFMSHFGITESDVRTYWFSGLLERKLAYKWANDAGHTIPTAYDEQFANHILSSIRKHYRQIWQIDTFYMSFIESWDARRVGVINNYDHYSPPSPLWADYCVIPTRRSPTWAKRTAAHSKQAFNWLVDTEDANRKRPTAGTVYVVSQPLGIFGVSYPPLVDMTVARIIPSALDALPAPSLSLTDSLLERCHLTADFTLDTIISVIWATDTKQKFDGEKKYYHVKKTFTGGLGPEVDYLSETEYARFKVFEIDDSVDYQRPLNNGIIEAVASAESAKIFNQFRDRFCGIVTLAGYANVYLTGNIKSVTVSFTPSAGLETHVDMREIPFAPTLEQTLPQNVINYLHKHATRGEVKAQAFGGVI